MKVDPLPLPVLVLQLLDALLPAVLIVPQLLFNPLSVQVRGSVSVSAARCSSSSFFAKVVLASMRRLVSSKCCIPLSKCDGVLALQLRGALLLPSSLKLFRED